MIKWKRNYTYFYELAIATSNWNDFSQQRYWDVIDNFAVENRCYLSPDGTIMTCNDEDFVIIMLKFPEAVEKVYD